MKLIMESWRKFLKEEASDKEIEDKITSTDDEDPGVLKKEGGAAGLKAIKSHIKKELGDELPEDFDLEDFLDGLDDVGEHTDGDYIQDDGEEIQVTKENIRDIVEGIEIFLEEKDDLLDEKKKRKKKKKKKKKKKDACYRKVRARYDVWPSAYASGALVKCRKVGAANWGNKSKKKKK